MTDIEAEGLRFALMNQMLKFSLEAVDLVEQPETEHA